MLTRKAFVALAAGCLILGPVGLEGRGAHPGRAERGGADGLANGRFSLAGGVVLAAVSGFVDGSFVATGTAICFLPGTFDRAIDGSSDDELRPSSHCGSDAKVRIRAFSEVRIGEEAARTMTIGWTDLAGRTYTLRFEADKRGEGHDVRVLCLSAAEAGCQSAVVDTAHAALVSEDGLSHDTGSRARLTLVAGPDVSDALDLGVYDVPFTLTIEQGDPSPWRTGPPSVP